MCVQLGYRGGEAVMAVMAVAVWSALVSASECGWSAALGGTGPG